MEKLLKDLPAPARAYLDGRRLDEVECIIADLPGIARGKAVPARKFARQGSFHLPNSIFFKPSPVAGPRPRAMRGSPNLTWC